MVRSSVKPKPIPDLTTGVFEPMMSRPAVQPSYAPSVPVRERRKRIVAQVVNSSCWEELKPAIPLHSECDSVKSECSAQSARSTKSERSARSTKSERSARLVKSERSAKSARYLPDQSDHTKTELSSPSAVTLYEEVSEFIPSDHADHTMSFVSSASLDAAQELPSDTPVALPKELPLIMDSSGWDAFVTVDHDRTPTEMSSMSSASSASLCPEELPTGAHTNILGRLDAMTSQFMTKSPAATRRSRTPSRSPPISPTSSLSSKRRLGISGSQ